MEERTLRFSYHSTYQAEKKERKEKNPKNICASLKILGVLPIFYSGKMRYD